MGCKSCSERAKARRLVRLSKKTPEVTLPVLEARFQICINCPHHKLGQCELLHGDELADYAKRVGAVCPHPERFW